MLKEIEGEGVKRDRSHWTAWSLWTVLQTGMLKYNNNTHTKFNITNIYDNYIYKTMF